MTTTVKRDKTFTRPVNWITTFFMVAFHVGAVIALFMFGWKPFLVAFRSLVGCRWPRHRHGLSPAAHASRLQDAEVG